MLLDRGETCTLSLSLWVSLLVSLSLSLPLSLSLSESLSLSLSLSLSVPDQPVNRIICVDLFKKKHTCISMSVDGYQALDSVIYSHSYETLRP